MDLRETTVSSPEEGSYFPAQELNMGSLDEGASQVALVVKNPSANAGDIKRCGFNPLEKGMATHSSILAWRIPWTEEPGRLQSIGLQRIGHD